jgi:hypothetical protein
MPKPTNSQELTARYLAAGAGFKPKEQFKALLNAASHVVKNISPSEPGFTNNFAKVQAEFSEAFGFSFVLEPLADDKAPF